MAGLPKGHDSRKKVLVVVHWFKLQLVQTCGTLYIETRLAVSKKTRNISNMWTGGGLSLHRHQ